MNEGKREAQFRFLAEAADEGFGGKVHAGAVMKWIDQAAYACATAWSGKRCIAAFVGETHFVRAIHIGEVVDVRATLAKTGRTSMRILVRVATADARTLDHRRATECVLVFVALDEAGRPTQVPSLALPGQRDEQEWAPLRSTNPDWAWNSP
jgi:acyl-CoA hydrolase